MQPVFCTIITESHLFHALALRDSLCRLDPTVQLHVLVVDMASKRSAAQENAHNIKFHEPALMCASGMGRALFTKYHGHAMDRFRWSMKAVFLNHLFQHEAAQKAIYVDADIYFFNPYDFLFQELDSAKVLLSPHWRSSDAVVDAANFEKNFTEGLFNGGFFGATAEAAPILDWWAQACLYECAQNRERGLYDDQKYLDLMPVFFEGVKVLRHRGCNVAEWNAVECKRTLTETGQVLINSMYPIVFIHFTSWLYRRVLGESDYLLKPLVERQVASLREYNPEFQIPMPKDPPPAPAPKSGVGLLNKLRSGARKIKSRI